MAHSFDALTRAATRHRPFSRWLLPFRAIWAPCGEAFVCGSMSRETELINAGSGKHLAKLCDPLLTAVPSRHAVAADGTAIAAATASGRIHVWRS